MKYLVAVTLLILALCLLCSFMPTEADMEVYDRTVRLHVLANSDSTHDQSVKLMVRDAVLDELRVMLEDADGAEDAASILSENLDRVRRLCEEKLAELGEPLFVTVCLSEEKYPTRSYGELRLPAGTYQSLRIELGDAVGRNWWCVLYPALCTDVAKTEASFVKTGFTSEQIEVLTGNERPKYKIRFKILEFLGENFF